MNKWNGRYFPVLLYSLLLVAIWVSSWIMGIAGLLSSGVQRNESLLSAQGVRWALRSATDSLEAAPWGAAVLCVVALGLLYGSGLLETLALVTRRKPLSHNRKMAAIMSLLLFLSCAVLVLLCTFSPWNILTAATSGILSSPLAVGFLPLFFVVVLAVAAMHGAVSGYYRSFSDVLDGVCRLFSLFLPAFVAMIPASGLLPCLSYVGVGEFAVYVEPLLYAFPFIFLLPASVKSLL